MANRWAGVGKAAAQVSDIGHPALMVGLTLFNGVEETRHIISVGLGQDTLQCQGVVVRSHGRAITPLNIRAQMKDIAPPALQNLPTLRNRGDNLSTSAHSPESKTVN